MNAKELINILSRVPENTEILIWFKEYLHSHPEPQGIKEIEMLNDIKIFNVIKNEQESFLGTIILKGNNFSKPYRSK